MDLRLLPSLDPASFVEMAIPIRKKKKELPLYMWRPYEKEEAKIFLAWSEEGLSFTVEVYKPVEETFFPDSTRGDGLLLLVDTRGIAGTRGLHKYCHHFLILPEDKEGILGREITPIHLGDRHPLASSESLKVTVTKKQKSYSMEIEIPQISLFGYDPHEYKRLKFAAIVYRKGEDPLYFPLSGKEYKLETNPELWTFLEIEQ